VSETARPEALVETALEQLISWPGLARSPQLAKFLNYIVRAKLRGDEGAIKAYSIAVDVFGRPQSFDPQTDPIVRVQARRLRAALDEFYSGEGASSPVRIHLPVGRYVPEFRYRDESNHPEAGREPATADEPVAPPPQFRRHTRSRAGRTEWMLYALVLGAGLGIAVVLMQVLTPKPVRIDAPGAPTIGISEFTAIQPGRVPVTMSVAGLALELVTDLQLFDDVEPSYLQSSGDEREPGPEYLLTGIARPENGVVQITASLRKRGNDTALWSSTQSIPADKLETSVDDLSQVFAEQLGSHRGPLFVDANLWLDNNPNISGNETVFLCGLLFTRYRDSAQVADAARARDCISSVLARGDNALAFALRAGLLLDDAQATQPLGLDPEPLAEAGRLLAQAVKLDATSSAIWWENARYLYRADRITEAEAAYASALQLNPANLDARAGYGRMLTIRGPSELGEALAREALARAIAPPHWYYAAPAVNALRANDDTTVIAHCDRLASGDAELASVLGTVAAYRSGDASALNRYFAQLLDVTRFRLFGILPVLRQRLPDTLLVEEIARQLKSAGVSADALNGSF
jgi:tetratricopeptide (TPR) repeat protein